VSAVPQDLAVAPDVPLVVDLDGTLILTDLLQESALKFVRRQPLSAPAIALWLLRGKAHMKEQIARRTRIDIASLPYNEPLLAFVRRERSRGRAVVLCTAADEHYARMVADELGLFTEVIASDGSTNVSAARKASILVGRYGEQGFDYAGNSTDDLRVWPHARHAIVVNARPSVSREARRRADVALEIAPRKQTPLDYVRAMRLHQWMKNLLVLLPLAGAHRLGEWPLLLQALVAFVAFGLCASGLYVVNDLFDLESDRAHPSKRNRPFASGRLSPLAGIAFAFVLLAGSAALAANGREAFRVWLAAYVGLTLAYTFALKRRVIVDCMTLGGLYTLRIVAGWSAVGLPASFWLLAFSLFLFLSLAFVKRYSELKAVAKRGDNEALGRGYVADDLPLVQVMGVAAGFGSVMLLALYINGDTVLHQYSKPELLWMTVPIHLYWISRMWMQAQRDNMHHDPVVFALRDRTSLACGLLFVLTLAAAR
jgi:4-hydroxybenzoate polyprenyltransferase/phosphoserine phosphatase